MHDREITLLASELTLSNEHHMRLKESEHIEAVKRSSLIFSSQLEAGEQLIYLLINQFIHLFIHFSSDDVFYPY